MFRFGTLLVVCTAVGGALGACGGKSDSDRGVGTANPGGSAGQPAGSGRGGSNAGDTSGASGSSAGGAGDLSNGGEPGAGMGGATAGTGTAVAGSAESGGSPAAGGSDAGAGMLGESGGMTGEAGSGNECEPLPVHSSSFCVLGTPLDGDAVELTAGMPLTVSGEPEGCYSSSCDKVELDYCAVIGSDRFYSVSLAYCRTSVGTPGGACTGDCARQSLECAPGVTLEEGEYTINSAGSGLTVTFTVPSQVHQAQLCAPAVQ